MNDIERAIETLYGFKNKNDDYLAACGGDDKDIDTLTKKENTDLSVAIQALTEKLERDKGCENCDGLVHGAFTTAYYCFNCGRKLGGE